MNKLGIELAANFIVILIVSLVMFGLAGGITYKIMCASESKIEQIDETGERYIEQKLNSGANVQVAIPVKETKAGASFCGTSSKPSASYSIGIRNDGLQEAAFDIKCDYQGMETPTGVVKPAGLDFCDQWNLQKTAAASIDPKQKQVRHIVLTVPAGAPAGRHIFTLSVTADFDPVGSAGPADRTCSPQCYGVSNIYLSVE